MKKIMTLCLAVGLMAGLAVNASAADYEFSTGDSTEYYGIVEDALGSCYAYCVLIRKYHLLAES